VGLSLLLLSLWWAPFGWDSWGNRLILPTMLASIIACLFSATFTSKDLTYKVFSINLPALGNQKNIVWRLLRLGVISIYLPLSLGYMVIINTSDLGPLYYLSLHGGVKCKVMMHKLDEQPPKEYWSFWRTKPYYMCARERFLHVPY
jgi:hypothetical protein